ncbi:MAG: serine O-acetyltransferase [Calditrichaceae bacterium]
MKSEFAEMILKNRHENHDALPPKHSVHQFLLDLVELLFPHFSGEYTYFQEEEIDAQLKLLERDLKKILAPIEGSLKRPIGESAEYFFSKLPDIYHKLWLDAKAIHEGDPASESIDEVISAYPGFFAIYSYRVAHEFYELGIPIFPRILSEFAHYRSGVDIHPGALLGESLCIDHGTGVVVGETTVIGNNVKIYQGVTLGALSVDTELSHTKRHPTIEDNVVIYSNATILGGKTIIGHDSIIGGNVWLTQSVPPLSMVYNTSEIKVRPKKLEFEEINYSI